ncbi:hypothetical protein N2152v2_002040 [Parachlorella kessleri]
MAGPVFSEGSAQQEANESAAGLAAAEEFLLGKEELDEEEQQEEGGQQQPQQRPGAIAAPPNPTEQPEATALNLIRRQPAQPAREPGPDPVAYLGPPPPGVLRARRPAQPQQQPQQEGQRQRAAGEQFSQHQQPQQAQGRPQQAQQGSRELVEADEIHEPTSSAVLDELVDDEDDPALRRKSQLLMDIMDSGEQVEERIQQHQDDIDGDMLQLLTKRIELASALQQNEAVEGLQLLYRRLKAEVDRKAATPAMRLLDDLLNILDPSTEDSSPVDADSDQADDVPGMAASAETGGGRGGGGSTAAVLQAGARAMLQQREARRQRAVTRMQAAFGLGLPEDADVVALAAQLAEGGEQVAEGLFGEPVDPERFLAEVSELLDQAAAQREQVAEYLESLGPGNDLHRAEVEAALEQRDQAMALVQQVLELVAAFTSRQRQQRLQAFM